MAVCSPASPAPRQVWVITRYNSDGLWMHDARVVAFKRQADAARVAAHLWSRHAPSGKVAYTASNPHLVGATDLSGLAARLACSRAGVRVVRRAETAGGHLRLEVAEDLAGQAPLASQVRCLDRLLARQ